MDDEKQYKLFYINEQIIKIQNQLIENQNIVLAAQKQIQSAYKKIEISPLTLFLALPLTNTIISNHHIYMI